MSEASVCVRCDAVKQVGFSGYCVECLWAVRVEIESGLRELGSYLDRRARSSEADSPSTGGATGD